jgi:hypothetical protein
MPTSISSHPPAHPARARARARLLNRAARARIYLKDPLITAQRKGRLFGEVFVRQDNLITAGPTSSRFIVIDYDPQSDRVEPPALYRKAVLKGEPILEFFAPADSPQEAQINAWATAVDTLDLFQQPLGLGREIQWAFEGSRLRILPHAIYEANAFYSRDTRALHLGYFTGRNGRLIKTALSHDVIAHETGHAVLDGLRPFYLDAHEPETGAFHEFIGDLAAMLSMFRDARPVAEIARADTFGELVSSLAPQVGQGVYGQADRNFLRSARNDLTYRDVADEPEIHRRSQVLSGFAFDAMEAIFAIRLREVRKQKRKDGKSDRLTKGDRFTQLIVTATRNMVRMFVRPLDFLPPGSIQFKEYVAILLCLDEWAYPNDRLKYRETVKNVARARGLMPDRETPTPVKVNNRNLIQRKIENIRSSRVGAYRFLNANRGVFKIPETVDFRVVGMATNRREGDEGVLPTPETIIQYVWDQYLEVPDVEMPGDYLVLHPGGTLVVDDNVNVLYWMPQFFGEERLERVRRHVADLAAADEIDREPRRNVRSDRLAEVTREATGAIRLRINPALMHRERSRP